MAKKPAETPAGFQRLKTDLKQKQLGRCYVLYGEEDYLREQFFEEIKIICSRCRSSCSTI